MVSIEMIGHILDGECIFTYRMLAISRGAKQPSQVMTRMNMLQIELCILSSDDLQMTGGQQDLLLSMCAGPSMPKWHRVWVLPLTRH
jgi:hypothetical protein